MSNQKGITHLILLMAVIVVLGIGGWWMWRNDKLNVEVESPTPPTTDNSGVKIPDDWKTYTNEEYGISFRYPSDWYWENTPGYPTEETPINISFFEQGNEADHSFGDHVGNEVFGVNLQKDSRSLKSIKDEYYKNADELQISGRPAIKTSFNLYIVKLDHNYQLTIMTDKLDSEEVRKQILSTFEFLDATITEQEKKLIDNWIEENDLNNVGDPKHSLYPGGSPLYNEFTGERIDRYEYIIGKHPDKPWDN